MVLMEVDATDRERLLIRVNGIKPDKPMAVLGRKPRVVSWGNEKQELGNDTWESTVKDQPLENVQFMGTVQYGERSPTRSGSYKIVALTQALFSPCGLGVPT